MKTLRTTITMLFYISLIILFGVLSIYYSNLLIMFIGYFVIFLLYFIFVKLENKKIFNQVQILIEDKKYDEAISLLHVLKNKVFMMNSYNSCIITLIQLYMITDELEKAHSLLNTHQLLKKKNKNLYYINFIIAICENDQNSVNEYFNKIQKLDGIFIKQKELSKKILDMISSNKFDETVYNNTNFPVIKRLCERCNSDEVKILIDNSDNSKNSFIIKRLSKGERIIKIILNILSVLSLFIVLLILNIKVSKYEYLTHMEISYYIMNHMWILHVLIVIPVANIIYSIYLKNQGLKYKDSLSISIIMCILLLIFGSFSCIFNKKYSFDKKYFERIENLVGIEMADDYTILTENYEDTSQTSSDGVYMLNMSIVRFNESAVINHGYWMDKLSNHKLVPSMFITLTKDFEHFIIYDETLDLVNPTTLENHKYIIMAFDVEYCCVLIYEYEIK